MHGSKFRDCKKVQYWKIYFKLHHIKKLYKGILKRIAKSIKLKIGNQCRKSLKPKDSSLKGPIKLVSLWPG